MRQIDTRGVTRIETGTHAWTATCARNC